MQSLYYLCFVNLTSYVLCETDLSRDIANKTYLDSPVAGSRTTGQEKLVVIVVVPIAVPSKYEAAKKIRN